MSSMSRYPKITLLTTALGSALLGDAFEKLKAPEPTALVERLNLIKHYPANEKGGRDFVVGDLHGCFDILMSMLAQMGFDFEKDRLFCTGDLADRGPDSIKCILLLRQPWFKCVAGNHEEMLLRAASEPNFDWKWWIENGGIWATTVTKEVLQELAELVAELPLAIAVGEGDTRFNVIHAEWYGSNAELEEALTGVESTKPVPLALTWGREILEGKVEPKHDDLSVTFVGHSMVPSVSRLGRLVYIDTGAFRAHFRKDDTYAMTIVEPASGTIYRSTAAAHGAVSVAA